ncbi:MAG: hypothetical protein ABH914_01525 [Candidatus Omnitrophota bacterium]
MGIDVITRFSRVIQELFFWIARSSRAMTLVTTQSPSRGMTKETVG